MGEQRSTLAGIVVYKFTGAAVTTNARFDELGRPAHQVASALEVGLGSSMFDRFEIGWFKEAQISLNSAVGGGCIVRRARPL